jgi:hypothetical protein
MTVDHFYFKSNDVIDFDHVKSYTKYLVNFNVATILKKFNPV